MGFEHVAKDLLKKSGAIQVIPVSKDKIRDKIKLAEALAKAGFSVEETCHELRTLYDECDESEKGIKRQILETIAKMNGMLTPDPVETGRMAPVINLQVNGDNVRVNAMLCPSVPE